MALASSGRSTLNPDAPLFIPAAVRQVEDFSPEWWDLVTNSAWFQDYWLSQQQGEDGFSGNGAYEYSGCDVADLLPDSIDLGINEDFPNMEVQYEEFIQSGWAGKEALMEGLRPSKSLNEGNSSIFLEENAEFFAPAKYWQEPAKFLSPKCSPRHIQQPR